MNDPRAKNYKVDAIKLQGRDSQKVLSLGNFFAKTNLKVMTFVLAKISLKLGFTKSA